MTILLLFVVGLGVCIINFNKISGFMDISSETNLIVKEMFVVREIEKEFFQRKDLALLKTMDQNVGLLVKRTIDLSETTASKNLSAGLREIKGLIQEYHKEFQQTAKYTNEIDQLKNKMKVASDTIFTTVETKIRRPVLEMQNSALITGEEVNPVFDEVIKVMDSLMLQLKDAWAFEKSFYLYNDPEYVTRFNTKLKSWSQVKSDLDYLFETADDANQTAAYAVLKQQFEVYNEETMSSIYSLYETNDKISKVTQNKGKKILLKVQQLQQKAQNTMISSKNFTINLAIGLLISVVVFGLGATYLIVISITRPINKTVEFVQTMAKGDFTSQFEINQKDEIGLLSISLNSMMKKLSQAIVVVRLAVDNIAAGSKELNIAAQQLSEGAVEQSLSVDKTATDMDEISSRINQNSSVINRVEKLTQKASKNAEKSGQAVSKATIAMKEIAGKTLIVEEIARQTNLLALNAAIEAARAGEHGKGFAVVAGEVRKLAEKSQKAAGDISELSSSSVEVAEQTQSMLEKLVPEIQQTSQLIPEVNASNSEQNSRVKQVNGAIKHLESIIQNNASSSEEIASISDELASQAIQLEEAIRFFKIDTQGSSLLADALSGTIQLSKPSTAIQSEQAITF